MSSGSKGIPGVWKAKTGKKGIETMMTELDKLKEFTICSIDELRTWEMKKKPEWETTWFCISEKKTYNRFVTFREESCNCRECIGLLHLRPDWSSRRCGTHRLLESSMAWHEPSHNRQKLLPRVWTWRLADGPTNTRMTFSLRVGADWTVCLSIAAVITGWPSCAVAHQVHSIVRVIAADTESLLRIMAAHTKVQI